MNKKHGLLVLLLVVFDQLIKVLVTSLIETTSVITIIPSFFNITNVVNYGAAWSILSGNRLVLIAIAIISIIALYFMFIKDKPLSKIEALSYSVLLSGIIGNLIDRVRLGYVIDYLEFNIFGYNFPIFNLADIFITTSVVLIIYSFYKEGVKHE